MNQRPIQPASHALGIWKEEFIGRPSRLRALAELIRFIKGHPRVWFATCREIAEVASGQLT